MLDANGLGVDAAAESQRRYDGGMGMGMAEPVPRTLKVAFLALVFIPVVAGLAWANTAAKTVAVPADLTVSSDGRTVVSEFRTNSCGEPLRLDVRETEQSVAVRTLTRQGYGLAMGCEDIAILHRLERMLTAPLGSRVLVVDMRSESDG